MYRTDCDTAQPVLLNRLSKVNTSCGPARQIFIYMWGAEGREGYHILMSDWRAIMTTQMPPWTACVHFPDLYPIDVSQLSFNFLCQLLLQFIYLNGLHSTIPPPPPPQKHTVCINSTFSLERGEEVREKTEGQQYTSIVPLSFVLSLSFVLCPLSFVHKLGRKYQPMSEGISSL